MEGYLSFGVYVAATITLVVAMLLFTRWASPKRSRGRAANEPYESGVVPVGTARIRLSAKFYLIALFFVIFDLEAVYLLTWAVAVREAGWAGFIEASIFIVVLLVALAYLWRLGALDWRPPGRYRRVRLTRTGRVEP